MSIFVKLKNPTFWGVLAGVLLLLFYFAVLTLANSLAHALEQFELMRYWILLLVLGFSFQVGLYSYIRMQIKAQEIKAANKEVAASTGISTGSMIACCAHHLVDVLPVLGLSAAFLFLAEYQVFLIILGILSNIVGIILMLEIIKRHSLHREIGILNRTSQMNVRALRNWAISGSVLLLIITFFLIRNSQSDNSASAENPSVNNPISEIATPQELTDTQLDSTELTALPSRIDEGGGLSIEVRPTPFSFDKPIRFEISLNTHQGNLEIDLTKAAVLVDDHGQEYSALEWQGGSGGHHLSGILIFPGVAFEVKKITLKIFNVYNIDERIFEWDL